MITSNVNQNKPKRTCKKQIEHKEPGTVILKIEKETKKVTRYIEDSNGWPKNLKKNTEELSCLTKIGIFKIVYCFELPSESCFTICTKMYKVAIIKVPAFAVVLLYL